MAREVPCNAIQPSTREGGIETRGRSSRVGDFAAALFSSIASRSTSPPWLGVALATWASPPHCGAWVVLLVPKSTPPEPPLTRMSHNFPGLLLGCTLCSMPAYALNQLNAARFWNLQQAHRCSLRLRLPPSRPQAHAVPYCDPKWAPLDGLMGAEGDSEAWPPLLRMRSADREPSLERPDGPQGWGVPHTSSRISEHEKLAVHEIRAPCIFGFPAYFRHTLSCRARPNLSTVSHFRPYMKNQTDMISAQSQFFVVVNPTQATY